MDTSSNDYRKIKELIDKATNDMFFQPDLTLNFSIVDLVNSNPSKSAIVVHALKSRLLESNEDMVITLCMDLYEALMKNCESIIPQFGRRDFQEAIVKIAMESKSFRVRDKILDLIQFLADGYNDRTDLFYSQAYKVLLYHHKVTFPPKRDETYTPPKKAEKTTSSQPSFNPYSFDTQNLHKSSKVYDSFIHDPFGLGHDLISDTTSYESIPIDPKRQPSSSTTTTTTSSRHTKFDEGVYKQLRAAKESIILLLDLLDNTPQGRELRNNEVVNEVLNECKNLRKTFLKMIEECVLLHNEKLFDDVLKLNDQLSDVINEYNKALKGERVVVKRPQKKVSPKSKEPKKKKKEKKSKKSEEVDEFALLASRKRPDTQVKDSNLSNNNNSNNIFLSNNNNNTMFQNPLQSNPSTINQLDFFTTGSNTQPIQSNPSLFNTTPSFPQQYPMNPQQNLNPLMNTTSSLNEPSSNNLFNLNQQSPLQTQQSIPFDQKPSTYNPFAQDIGLLDQNINITSSMNQLSLNNNDNLFNDTRSSPFSGVSSNNLSSPSNNNVHEPKKVNNPFENLM